MIFISIAWALFFHAMKDDIIKNKGEKIMEALIYAIQYAADRWQEVLLFLVISCSVAIFLTGALKLAVYNRLKNKLVRKAVCFTTGLALTCGVTAVYFAIASFAWQFYGYSLLLSLPFCIVLYTLYENYLVRDAVDFVAKKFIAAIIPVAAEAVAKGEKNAKTKQKLIEAVAKVKKETARVVADDLEKL